MADCQSIITSAYRRAGINAAGVPPSATKNTTGMERLVDLYHDLIATGLFGRLEDVYLVTGSVFTALEGQRITCEDATVVVTIPTIYYSGQSLIDPYDYDFSGTGDSPQYTSNGIPRAPADGAVIQVIQPGVANPLLTYLYDTNAGIWQQLENLVLSSNAPLSGRYAEGLKNVLAVFLADEFGYQVRPLLARQAARFKLTVGSRYDGPRKVIKQRSNFF